MDKPKHGIIFDKKKNAKALYKASIRSHQKIEKETITNSLHEALSNKSHGSFWKIWRSKFGKGSSVPTIVDGLSDDNAIANKFARYFANVCSVQDEVTNVKFSNTFSERFSNYTGDTLNGDEDDICVQVELVDKIIGDLKEGKAAGLDHLSIEHLKFSHPSVCCIITKLFNLMMRYNYVPTDFGQGLTIPLLKNASLKKSCSTEDFRGITVSPVISKIFEVFLKHKMSKYLESSKSQFGFKKGFGCNHAIYTVQSTIEYFTSNNSTVNVCSIDLVKAFDKLNHCVLFSKLMDRNVPRGVIVLLQNWYEKSNTVIKWNSARSLSVKLTAGVRQGGVLSPLLFAVFVDDVLIKLERSGMGCHINHTCFNCVMYADDLLLMSISNCDLQHMVDLCVNEFHQIDMKINIGKSVCMRIGNRHSIDISKIVVNSVSMEWKKDIRYLGVSLVSANNPKYNLQNVKQKYFRALNGIFGKVGTQADVSVIISLINSFCVPVLLYGLDAFKLNKAGYTTLESAYSAAFSKLFSTNNADVIRETQFFCGALPLKFRIDLRRINFLITLKESNNLLIRVLSRLSGEYELNKLLTKYRLNIKDNHTNRVNKLWKCFEESFVSVC